MKYIFLTYIIDGVAGGPSYVSNKTKWLNEKGWDVVVFDHYGGLNTKGEIILDNLLQYENNRMLELFFPPSYYSIRQRERILTALINKIGKDNEYVVESNSTRLALWGEILSERLGAKHLILEIGEYLEIRSKKEYEFINFKYERNEWFAIAAPAVIKKFENWKNITEKEADGHVFCAIMGVKLQDTPLMEMNDFPKATYKILSFGRRKPYFDNMIKSIVGFAELCPDKHVNFIMMGDVELSEDEKRFMNTAHNLFYKVIPPQRPVPKAIFDYSDVVIATAGCAGISFRAGYKTISMNVENGMPLGVMGYTTLDSTFINDDQQSRDDLVTLLKKIIINKEYDAIPILKREPKGIRKGYEYQMSLINEDRKYWKNVDEIPQDRSRIKRWVETIILRCGMIAVFAK